MDEASQRKSINRIPSSKKESAFLSNSTVGRSNQNTQFCNRLGCSGRLKSNPIQKATIEKLKSPMQSFHPRKGDTTIETSSRACPSVFKTKRSFFPHRQKGPLYEETDGSNVCEFPVEQDAIEHTAALPCKSILKSRAGNDAAHASSSSSVVKPGPRPSRYNIKNLRCDIVSDVIPSVSFSQESILSRKKDVGKRRNTETEGSSSSKGKKIGDPSFSRDNGILTSDSRRSMNSLTSLDSARNQPASSDGNARSRFGSKKNGSSRLRAGASPLVISEREASVNGCRNSSAYYSRRFPDSPTWPNSSSLRGRRGVAISQSSMGREGMWCRDVDGIAEVLMALDRIEQDAGITYEQLLFLETNILHNGLAFHDQHVDLRMDIDNMSYEELLELEDRMGIVSTPLSEEAFMKCVKQWTFNAGHSGKRLAALIADHDDVKCSICQEEYMGGDEMGTLRCEHRYHFDCIRQWLRLKNWCPICKASAELSCSVSPT